MAFLKSFAQDYALEQAQGYGEETGITTYISGAIVGTAIFVIGTVFSYLQGPLSWILPWVPITPLFIFNLLSWTLGWFIDALAFDVKGWVVNFFPYVLAVLTTGPFIVLPFVPFPPVQMLMNFFDFGLIDALVTLGAGMGVAYATGFAPKDSFVDRHRNNFVILSQVVVAMLMVFFM